MEAVSPTNIFAQSANNGLSFTLEVHFLFLLNNRFMKFWILFGLILLFQVASAQGNLNSDDSIDSIKPEQYATPMIFASLDPATSIFNPLHPRWRIGYTHFIKPDLGLGLDIGYGNDRLNPVVKLINPNRGADYEIWEVKLRAYKLYHLTGQPKYIGLEATILNQSNTREDDYYVRGDRSISFTRAKYSRQKYALNVRYGHLFEIAKNLWIDGYVGLGLKFREVRFEDVLLRNVSSATRILRISSEVKEGTHWGANFSFGVNLLFRFR